MKEVNRNGVVFVFCWPQGLSWDVDCFCDLAGICLFGRFGFFGFVLVFVFSFRVFLVLRGLGEHKIGWIRR